MLEAGADNVEEGVVVERGLNLAPFETAPVEEEPLACCGTTGEVDVPGETTAGEDEGAEVVDVACGGEGCLLFPV